MRVGDIIKVGEGEQIPADMILLESSSGDCFVQTSNLDGERALKHKQCLSPISNSIKRLGDI